MPSAAYDAIAAWYDATVRSDSFVGHVFTSQLLTLLGDVDGRYICDLACGQGRIARRLAQGGAQVVGVDISAQLIAIAQRDEAAQPLGITYILDNAETLTALDAAQFHGVVCNLALMDIPDLAAVYRAVWRILRPAGWFVFSITHPCFESPHAAWLTAPDGTISREIFSYFTEGLWRSSNPEDVRGQVGANHRMLSTYLNTLSQTGFVIDLIHEPQPANTASVPAPGYRVIPAFMLVRCMKPSSDTKQLNQHTGCI